MEDWGNSLQSVAVAGYIFPGENGKKASRKVAFPVHPDSHPSLSTPGHLLPQVGPQVSLSHTL